MFVYERPVRFEDCDPAKIVFFARFLSFCHEAMEAFFGALDGGYSRLICERNIGVPAVRVTADFHSPLRYGDVMAIAVTVPKIGTRSCTFRYEFRRADELAILATVEHAVVFCQLDTLQPVAIPPDALALLRQHV